MNGQVRINGDNVEGTRGQLGIARESAAQSEKGFDELRTMMALMRAKLHNIPRRIPDPGRSMNDAFDKQESVHHDYPMPTKCSTVEFPRFSGEDLRGWVFKCEQIFEIKHTPSEAKVGLAMMHLDGKALEWHLLLMKAKFTSELPNWEEYIRALHDRFGSLLYEDPMYELVSLRQLGNVRDYADRFELLLRNVELHETDAVSCFLDGLKAEIALQIRLFKPKTMMEVVSLAKLQEQALMLLGNKNSNNFSISMDSVVEIPAEDLRVDAIADVSSEGDNLAMNGLMVFDETPVRVPSENGNENRVMELANGRARIESEEVVVPEEMSRKVSSGNKTVNGIKELSIRHSLMKLPSEEDVTQFQESKVLPAKFGDGLTVYGAENCMVDSQMNEKVMVILGSRASVHKQKAVFVKIYSRFEMLKHATNVLSEMPRPLPEPPPRISYSSFIQYGPIATMRSQCSYGGAITENRKLQEVRSSFNPTLMASHVVILKLITSHADILEIRAHGPGKMTNLYLFVISRRITPNELPWQQLNRDFRQATPTAYRESSKIKEYGIVAQRFSRIEEMVNLDSINRKASNEWGTCFEEPRAAPRWDSQGQGIISNDGNLAMKVNPYRSPLIQKDEVEKWLQAMLSVGISLARHSCLIIQKDLIEKWVQAMIGAGIIIIHAEKRRWVLPSQPVVYTSNPRFLRLLELVGGEFIETQSGNDTTKSFLLDLLSSSHKWKCASNVRPEMLRPPPEPPPQGFEHADYNGPKRHLQHFVLEDKDNSRGRYCYDPKFYIPKIEMEESCFMFKDALKRYCAFIIRAATLINKKRNERATRGGKRISKRQLF